MSINNLKSLKNKSSCSVFLENGDFIVDAQIASSYFSRLKGLLGTKSLDNDKGLLIIPCTSIHMFFMSYCIDAIFLDITGMVVAVYHNLKPWKISKYHPDAYCVLEIPAGKARNFNIKKGVKLDFK